MDNRVLTPQMRAWVDQSQGMVRSIASQIFSRLPGHVNYDDLVSYGQLGLMQAAYSFQPNRNVTFQTFAYHRIRGSIYDGLGKMSWSSRAIQQRIRAEQMSAEILEQQLRAPMESAAQAMAEDAESLVRTTERIAVVHLLTDSGSDGVGIEKMAVDSGDTADEAMEHAETCACLRALVDELPDRERQLILLTYFEGKTLTDAAEELGKSKSWASRVHTRILEKLARGLSAQGND
ncbi:MAG: sigma-70 family RNA polymerase sigma factor [Planctomycetales bacterium]|nr:sigma-70 family RNA polymerase sigma factor [Planctomycetales bacterium]